MSGLGGLLIAVNERRSKDMEKEKNMQPQALENVTVLDLTRVVAGPYAGSILGDFGANVIKIEVPGKGDDARGYGPYRNGESVYYANLNHNKRGITLNLKEEKGKEVFKKLRLNSAFIFLFFFI